MTPHEEYKINKLLADFEGLEYLKPKEDDLLLFDLLSTPIDYSCDWHRLIGCYNRIRYYLSTHKIDSLDGEMNDFFTLCPIFKTLRPEPFFIKLSQIVNLINLNKNANS